MSQYAQALVFYVVFSLSALVGWPVIKRVVSGFAPAYVVSKMVGFAAFAYIIWLTASLRFLNYQSKALILSAYLLLTAIAAVYILAATLRNKNFDWKNWFKQIALIDGIGLVLYFIYLNIRSDNPAIYGTEKFMDMMMLTASGKTNYFPPLDSWMSGQTVNYYYYGHYIFSLIANLSGTAYNFAYNYSLALLFVVCVMLAFILAYKLTKSKFFALLGAFLVIGAGSLSYAGCVTGAILNAKPACYFGQATRLTDPSYIINEIPSYSFVVDDLHAHVLALPFFLTSLILLWEIFQTKELRKKKILLVALAIIGGTAGAVNSWDLVTIVFDSTLVAGYKIFTYLKRREGEDAAPRSKSELLHRLLIPFAPGFAYLIAFYPYWHQMKSQVGGLGFVPSFVSAWSSEFANLGWPSPAGILFGVWGVYVIFGGLALLLTKKTDEKAKKKNPSPLLEKIQERRFAILLFLASLCIIVGTELFFIEDIYSVSNPPFFRANSVFKFGFHAWTMFSISFAFAAYLLYEKIKTGGRYRQARTAYYSVMAIFLYGSLVFPYEGLNQFYLNMNVGQKTLDGQYFMQNESPDDLATVKWINENVSQRTGLIEAAGEDYKYFGRISAFTGMINPVNWLSHEWTWRYDFPKESWKQLVADKRSGKPVETGYSKVWQRSQDVLTIYTSPDLAETRYLLSKYDAKYIYIGPLERTTYPSLDEEKFNTIGKVIFQSGQSKLIEVNP